MIQGIQGIQGIVGSFINVKTSSLTILWRWGYQDHSALLFLGQMVPPGNPQCFRSVDSTSRKPFPSTNFNQSWDQSQLVLFFGYTGIPWYTIIYTTTFTQRHPHALCWASNALGSFFKVRYELWRGKARKNANNTVVLPNTKRVDSSELRTETNKTGVLNSDVILIWGWATKLSYHRIGELRIHSDLLIHTQRDLADILCEGWRFLVMNKMPLCWGKKCSLWWSLMVHLHIAGVTYWYFFV